LAIKRAVPRRAKRKSQPKTKTSAQLKQECYKAVQKLARLAASDDNGYCSCVSCGVTKHYKDMQGGHFIPKGNSSYWALEIENVHPQCAACNMWGMKHGSAAQAYTLFMEDMYGRAFVEEMLAKKATPVKRYKADYEEILSEFLKLIEHHEKRIA
jgi:hypothetical protein